ncbi:MAG TPA: MATE family efflux transporter [Candidatus Solibacter sp.]|nr:MATE family efflux transporter [Candidatus Solibacter sp.]
MSLIANLRRELRPMLRLAAPLALAELAWMAMGFVDIVMAGPLGAAAIGAGSLGNMLFFPIVICGTGMLLGMDTLVAQAFGAGDPRDCRRTLINGLWLGMGLAPVLAMVLWSMIPLLRSTGTNPRVLVLLVPYLNALLWGILPLMFYAAVRRYLQAMNIVRPLTFVAISANLVNIVGDWALMYGHLGARAMGLAGSGWSTSIARGYIAAVLLGVIVWHERKAGNPLFYMSWKPDFHRMRRLVGLGLPSAMQILIEGAVFGVVTVLAARLDEASLAAHSIAVNVVSTTYMVPLGISSAAAVRVGQAFGRRDQHGVAIAGWTALLLSGLFMGGAGLALAVAPGWIVRIYTRDAAVIRVGAVLLQIAALFQLFDGFQVVATGALRGLGDTRSPMLAHLAGYWAIGMPVVYVLCFPYAWGASGIWAGLSAALILIGIALVWVWRMRLHQNAHRMLV